ncbi:MAG: TetR/AcrR family transcriptional regulator [Caulobacteraceae bacterium]
MEAATGVEIASSREPRKAARRTQAERRAATRQRLLDAAIACLAERGYADTTTIAVAAAAGLSRGAMLHHFGTKAELLRAVGEEVMRQTEAILETSVAGGGERERFLRAFDGALVQLDSPYFAAAAELLMACRADPALRSLFADINREAGERTEARLRRWAAAAGAMEGPRLDAFLDLLSVTVRGTFFLAGVEGGRERARSALDALREAARGLLPPAGRPR